MPRPPRSPIGWATVTFASTGWPSTRAASGVTVAPASVRKSVSCSLVTSETCSTALVATVCENVPAYAPEAGLLRTSITAGSGEPDATWPMASNRAEKSAGTTSAAK